MSQRTVQAVHYRPPLGLSAKVVEAGRGDKLLLGIRTTIEVTSPCTLSRILLQRKRDRLADWDRKCG